MTKCCSSRRWRSRSRTEARPPDLAIEVISPRDTYRKVQEKVETYIATGTRMVIVINPGNQTATVTTPVGNQHLTIDDTLSGGDVVPGSELPLRELFAD